MSAARRYLPYVLEHRDGDRYAVFNRDYMPLGFTKNEEVDREIAVVQIKGMTDLRVSRMRHQNHAEDTKNVFFFDDGSAPWISAANNRVYQKRLAVFFKLEVKRG